MNTGFQFGFIWLLVQGWMNPGTQGMMVQVFQQILQLAEVLVQQAVA